MKNKLYVWTDQVKGFVGEHTWVSSYAPAFGKPQPEKGDYWHCNGDPRYQGNLLNYGLGGTRFANKISRSHDATDTVGIDYGLGGVCHQMANRLLRFSLDKNKKPITVDGATGYFLTKAMYGKYGEKVKVKLLYDKYLKWEEKVREYENEL